MDSKQLVTDCIKGKREAHQQLYQHYAAAMMGICYRYTKSIEDAEDVLQEGFIKVFTKLKQYKNEGELGGWIRKIMVNTAITYLNKHSRYRKEMQVDDMHLHPVSDDNPEIKLDTKDLVEIIRQLPAGYQTVFNLVAIEGFGYAEVAKMAGLNINTVRSRYSRARAQLITLIKKIDAIKEPSDYAGKI